jgi:ATP-binding cassette subfamily B protein
MKEKNNLLRLMDYAGSFKYFTIGSIVLSAVSACLALMPFVYIWKIIDEVLSVMPDYSKATNIEEYSKFAV